MICGNCRGFSARRIADLEGHWRACNGDPRWAKVAGLRASGRVSEAEGLVRRILGVKGAPMTEEARARVREYQRTHKDEIRERQRQRRVLRRILSRPARGLVRAR